MTPESTKRTEKRLKKEEKKERKREKRKRQAADAKKEIEQERRRWGRAVLSWDTPEYEEHERGRLWYVVAGIIIALLLIFCVYTANLLFALIIVITSFVIILQHTRRPERYKFAITGSGIVIGDNFYPYEDLDSFWIAYSPPEVKKVYFTFKSSFKPEIYVHLEDQNPLLVRDTLLDYLDEDLEREDETTSDQLRRFLRL